MSLVVDLQQLAILYFFLQICRLLYLNRGLHLDYGVQRWSKLVEIRKTKRNKDNAKQNQIPEERLHVICGQLQVLTTNHGPRN